MKKILKIEGMSCGHCKARVEKALNNIEGVSAVVELENKQAVVECANEIENTTLIFEVEDIGFKVTEIV